MIRRSFSTALFLVCAALAARANDPSTLDNPAIDMKAHLRIAREAAEHRQSRRVSEAEFIRMSREPGTLVLDARSKEKYDQLHVRGAVNLSFPDIAIDSLAKMIPDKETRILIYCNNNFRGAEVAFPSKAAPVSLNLSTYISLYTYGYRNVYELAPLLDAEQARLELVGTLAELDRPARAER